MDEVEILKDEARRGEEARRVIQSMAFLSAFDDIRKELQAQMSAVKTTDDVTKCKLIDYWKVVDSVERWFVKTIETGEAAELQIAERTKFNLFNRG